MAGLADKVVELEETRSTHLCRRVMGEGPGGRSLIRTGVASGPEEVGAVGWLRQVAIKYVH